MSKNIIAIQLVLQSIEPKAGFYPRRALQLSVGRDTPRALTTSPPNRQIGKMRRLDVSRERVALLASR